jgi:type I restriction enzyme R subunit
LEELKEQAEKNMPVDIFTVYWVLKNEGIDNPEERAKQMKAVLEKYPHWKKNKGHEREVKKKLYGILLKSGLKDKSGIVKVVQDIMRLLKGGVDDYT